MNRLTLVVIALALIVSTPALATSFCHGVVRVNPSWITLHFEGDLLCRVPTNSKLGREVLKKCPVGTDCMIDDVFAVPDNGDFGTSTIRRSPEVKRF
jgi:hypothetical protein